MEGPVQELLNPDETQVDVTILDNDVLMARLRQSEWNGKLMGSEQGNLTFKIHSSQIPVLTKWLTDNGAAVMEIRSKHSLEAYFLSLTND